jgi:hypothetical protein
MDAPPYRQVIWRVERRFGAAELTPERWTECRYAVVSTKAGALTVVM